MVPRAGAATASGSRRSASAALRRVLLALALCACCCRARVFFATPPGARTRMPGAGADGASPAGATSLQACVDRATAPGDECRLLAGTYRLNETVRVRGKRGTAAR